MSKELQRIFRPCHRRPAKRCKRRLFCIPSTRHRLIAVTIFLLACTLRLAAQETVRSITPSRDSPALSSRLTELVSRAAIIFSGQVASVEQNHAQNWTTVRFNVEMAVRGSAPGLFEANFIESTPGAFPLRPGERIVALLHGRNSAGITSFVANNCGLFIGTGGNRVDLGRLQICPLSQHSSHLSLPQPRADWPTPLNFRGEKSSHPDLFPIAGGTLLRQEPLSVALKSAESMNTVEFLSLLATIAANQENRDGVHPKLRAIDPDIPGLH